MSCSMSTEQKMCEEKIFQLQPMSNALISVTVVTYSDTRFAAKNSGLSCLALIFKLSYTRMTILHAKNQFKGGEI